MIRFITAAVDSFLPASLRGDPNARRQGRVLVWTAWVSALACGLAIVSRRAIAPLPPGPFAGAVLVILVLAAAPFVLRATGRPRLAGALVAFSSTAAVLAFIVVTGGLHQPVMVVLPFLPLATTFLVDRRAGVAVAVLAAVFVAVLFVLQRAGHELDTALDDEQTLTAWLVTVLLTLLLVTLLAGVSERHRVETEERLRLARRRAELSSAAKGAFLADMSHEIRTPIGGIIGVADLLSHLELSEEAREYAGVISSSADGLLHLVNEILDFSKIEADKMTIEALDFRLVEPVRGVVELLRSQAEAKGLALGLKVDPNLPEWVRSDPLRLRQVLLNLVGNAIKFTAEGAVELAVRMERRAGRDAHVSFRVRDTGIGISPELRERLFDPFTQADGSTARRFGGTGLGLTISRRLVELLGGAIDLESVPDRGSTFFFTLPLPILRKPGASLSSDAVIPTIHRSRCRILVVEDDPVNQMIVGRLLERLGFPADRVDNGYAALEALAQARYDVVLMDCQMPELDGYETCRRIRRTFAAHIPVIAVTAHAMQGDREKCIAAGMDDYLAKPYRQKDLAEVLERWLIFRDDGAAAGGSAGR